LKLLTAKVFDNAIEAHLWKTKLESEGLICFLFDENVVSTQLAYANALGGIKLKIREQDVERVKQIFLEAGDEAVRICPYCLSFEVQPYQPTSRWQHLLLVAKEAFTGKQHQQCQECKKIFF
jgi:hypothetical protein